MFDFSGFAVLTWLDCGSLSFRNCSGEVLFPQPSYQIETNVIKAIEDAWNREHDALWVLYKKGGVIFRKPHDFPEPEPSLSWAWDWNGICIDIPPLLCSVLKIYCGELFLSKITNLLHTRHSSQKFVLIAQVLPVNLYRGDLCHPQKRQLATSTSQLALIRASCVVSLSLIWRSAE